MAKLLSDISSVVSSDLCSGCGACAYMAAGDLFMEDVPESGRRPAARSIGASVRSLSEELKVCPGVGLEHAREKISMSRIPGLESAWGVVVAVYDGYAADAEIRFAGSSGGAATAISLYCLERGGMSGVLHTAPRVDAPYLNEAVMSRQREELLCRAGSRYAPASPCELLGSIEHASGRSVFIGKPCDVAAAQMARKLRPGLDEKLGLTIAFFCAGTPSTEGTLEMLKRMGIDDPSALVSLRYRGNGWPGKAMAVFKSERGEETRELTYQESWGEVLSKHQQWRCKLCADHTGEFADIAVGDPWYRSIEPGDPGRSLILARTERGRSIILAAAAAGYLTISEADPQILPASQPNLLRTRGAVWGRILACRLMGTPAPRYRNMPLFRHWLRELTVMEKVRSIVGTIRRIRRKRVMAAENINSLSDSDTGCPLDG